MKTIIGIMLAVLVATLALASCSSPKTAPSVPESSQAEVKEPVSSLQTPSLAPEAVVVATPSEPSIDINSVDQLSSDVDVDSLGKLDGDLKDLENLS